MSKTKITQGSGNVFADIGVRNPEESLAKANAARTVNKLIAERGLTQTKAAELLGIDQPRVCALAKGRLAVFSLEKILSFAAKLGSGVEIKIGAPNEGIVVVENLAVEASPYHHPERLYGSCLHRSIDGWAYGASASVTSTTPMVFFKSAIVADAPACPAWLAVELNDAHSKHNG